MNKKILLLAGAISALFAGKSASTTPTALELEPVVGARDIRLADEPSPVSSEPLAPLAAPRQVAGRAQEVGAAGVARLVDRPGRRRVKYGSHRWVLLG